jgi:hypothetical protein
MQHKALQLGHREEVKVEEVVEVYNVEDADDAEDGQKHQTQEALPVNIMRVIEVKVGLFEIEQLA